MGFIGGNMSKVSIIIPIYNVEAYLSQCLDSVINQSYKNIEIVCVNDGSTDNSFKILQEYSKLDKRIKVINQENKGLLTARIVGLKASTGDYIMNLDSDDYLDLDAVNILIDKINKYNVDVVRFNYYINENNITKSNYNDKIILKENFEPEFFDLLFNDNKLNSACCELFKRSQYDISENINLSVSMGEDIEYNLYLYPNISSILLIDNCLLHYRVNLNSITNYKNVASIKKNIDSAYIAYSDLFNSIEKFNINNKLHYQKILATRLINEIYYLELKLFSLINRKNKKEIIDFIVKVNARMKENGYYAKTSKKDIFKNARKHKIFNLSLYSNKLLLPHIYSKIIYKPYIRLRSYKNEIRFRKNN